MEAEEEVEESLLEEEENEGVLGVFAEEVVVGLRDGVEGVEGVCWRLLGAMVN